MMVLFLPVLDRSGLESLDRSADPSILRDALSARKNNRGKMTRRGSADRFFDVEVSLFFKRKKKINCLGCEFIAYLFVV